jgi:hypothetical protein
MALNAGCPCPAPLAMIVDIHLLDFVGSGDPSIDWQE